MSVRPLGNLVLAQKAEHWLACSLSPATLTICITVPALLASPDLCQEEFGGRGCMGQGRGGMGQPGEGLAGTQTTQAASSPSLLLTNRR